MYHGIQAIEKKEWSAGQKPEEDEQESLFWLGG
jgi:hypothetical protein